MQIVIDIPKVMFINAKSDLLFGADILVNAIKNGTPLPKGHGRLIDADSLPLHAIDDANHGSNYIRIAPTIIEAESEDKE